MDRTPLDGFVREQLAASLMNMKPGDGVAGERGTNVVPGGRRRSTVLLYSLSGPSIQLLQALPQGAYTGLWFDPRTGNTRPLEAPVAAAAGVTIQKPTAEAWLLLLRR